MSTDDAQDDAETSRPRRWPMSAVNTMLVGICAVAAIACFVLGRPFAGGVLLLAGLVGAVGAMMARRGLAGDLERVNALEYADERDRTAATKGLAAVGVLALVLSAAQLVVHIIVDTDGLARTTSTVMVLALTVGWFAANWYFVRRG